MQDEILAQMIQELNRLDNSPISETIIGDQVFRLQEPFTAGLMAIRLYPLLWPTNGAVRGAKKKLGDAILKRLLDCRPADGGGWPFFDRVLTDDEGVATDLIEPDADTTAVCWSALLLASEIKVSVCNKAFRLICDNLERDGDVYFDDSARLDIIALCNMLYFFLLYCEKYRDEHGMPLDIGPKLMDGVFRARQIVLFVLSLEHDSKVAYWLRYYIGSSASPLARVCGFVSPIVLRWPDSDFVRPLKEALHLAGDRLEHRTHSSFLDACMTALAHGDDAFRTIRHARMEDARHGKLILDHEAIYYTVLHKIAFVSSLFAGSCLLAVVSINQVSYVGQGLDVPGDCSAFTRPAINNHALLACILNSGSTIIMDDSVLTLTCLDSVEPLKNHFNRTFSPTVSYHSLTDALIVSEMFRVLLQRGGESLNQLAPRLKNARDLLVHCLRLTPYELVNHWTSSATRLRLSVTLICAIFRDSKFTLPLRNALIAVMTDSREQLLPERSLVEYACGSSSRKPSQDEFLFTTEDDILPAYARSIIDAKAAPAMQLPDTELEASKFKSHLNYEALKRIIKRGSYAAAPSPPSQQPHMVAPVPRARPLPGLV